MKCGRMKVWRVGECENSVSSDAELQEKKTQAFTDMSTEGMTFSFYHKPPL